MKHISLYSSSADVRLVMVAEGSMPWFWVMLYSLVSRAASLNVLRMLITFSSRRSGMQDRSLLNVTTGSSRFPLKVTFS